MEIEVEKEIVRAFVNPQTNYKCVITLPFETETFRQSWFDWYMEYGQQEFFKYAKRKGIALGEFRSIK